MVEDRGSVHVSCPVEDVVKYQNKLKGPVVTIQSSAPELDYTLAASQ